MAELGSIQRVNENAGVQPVDTRALESGISEGLDLVAEVHTRKVLEKAGDEVKQDLKQAGEDAQSVRVEESADDSLTPSEDKLRRKIIGWQSDAAEGPSRLQAAAELRIKTTMERLRNEHPRLAAKLDAEITGIARSSATLEELGGMDVARTAAATAAETKLRAFYTNATKTISQGGLGMPFDSDFTDPEVLRQFTTRNAQRATREGTELELAFLIADKSASNTKRLARSQDSLQGTKSRLSALLLESSESIREYTNETSKPLNEQRASIIDGFTARKEELIFTYEALRTTALTAHQAIWADPLARASQHYTMSKAVLDDRIKLIDDYIDGLRETKTAGYYETQHAALQSEAMELSHKRPAYREILRFNSVDENGNLYEWIKLSATGENVVVGQKISEMAVAGFDSVFRAQSAEDVISSLYYNSGQGNITPDMSPTQIAGVLRTNQRVGPSPFGHGAVTEGEQIESGLSQMDMMQRILQRIPDMPEGEDAAGAGKILTAGTTAMLLFNDLGNPAADELTMTVEILANDAILKGLRVVGNGDQKARRFAFGDAAQDFLGGANEPWSKKRIEMQQQYNTPRFGVAFSSLVSVDFDEDDRFTIEVDRDAVAHALFNERQIATVSSITPLTFGQWKARSKPRIDTEVRKVAREGRYVLDFANNDIRASAHVAYANAEVVDNDVTPSYRLWADRSGWLAALGIE